MRKEPDRNSYKTGDVVYAKSDPTLKLEIRRYIDRVYYCTISEDPDRKELVYYERELVANPELIAENKHADRWENEGGTR